MSNLKKIHILPSSSGEKRKHVALTVMQKVEILKKMDSGATAKHIANTYGIGVRTVYDIHKNKEKLLKFYSKSDSNSGFKNRKSLHEAKSTELDAVIYEWFRQRRSDGIPISGPILRQKAKEFHSELKVEQPCDFSAGWLRKFKQRHGIRYIKAYGEKLSADRDAAEEFIDEFSSFVAAENLTPEQIFNADETGIFWRCLPRRTFVTSEESTPSGVKEAKERLTVLVCSNAAGTFKSKLLVVGKSKTPRAMRGVKTMPVLYKNNKRAWITKDIFTEWFNNHFIKEVQNHFSSIGLPIDSKILLLFDNCAAHPDPLVLSSGNVITRFLPPNTTSIIQPMDQGIIRSLKCHYKTEFLKKILSVEPSYDIKEYKKMFNIKDCLYLLAESWDSVSKSTLVHGWLNLWPSSLFIETEDDNTEFSGFRENPVKAKAKELLEYANKITQNGQWIEESEIVSYIESDDVTDNFNMTDNEIIDSVLESQRVDDDSDVNSDDCSVNEQKNKILFDEGLAAGEKYLQFLEQQDTLSEQEIMTVYNIQKKLKLQHPKILKQTTLKEMFSKVKN